MNELNKRIDHVNLRSHLHKVHTKQVLPQVLDLRERECFCGSQLERELKPTYEREPESSLVIENSLRYLHQNSQERLGLPVKLTAANPKTLARSKDGTDKIGKAQ